MNVLLVTYDSVRPDHLPCYGYKHVKTKWTDWVADRGTLFSQALTSVPLTFPSHCSVMTGLEVYSHGVRENGTYFLRSKFETLAEILKRNGYETAAVVGTFVLDRRFGLKRGFSFYEDRLSEGAKEEHGWQGHKYGRFERPAEEVSDIAIKWLRENGSKRFFLWLHFFDAHHPYNPPEKYAREYGPTELGLYDGEIAYMDDQFGRILKELMKIGSLNQTAIIIFSDHGEVLGDHEMPFGQGPYMTHALFNYESEIRTTLVMMRGGLSPVRKRVDDMVRLSDITPTILDMLEISEDFDFYGSSLLPIINGTGARKLEEVYCETILPKERNNNSGVYTLRTEDRKIIHLPEEDKILFYDLSRDPKEKHILNNDVAKGYDIPSFLEKICEYRIAAEKEGRQSRYSVDEESRRKLKALGYM